MLVDSIGFGSCDGLEDPLAFGYRIGLVGIYASEE